MSDWKINPVLLAPPWVLERWILVAYLIPPGPIAAIEKLVNIKLNEKAVNELYIHAKAYIEEAKMPPSEISSVVLNIVDDLAANRAPTLRTGDYVALQTYMRGKR